MKLVKINYEISDLSCDGDQAQPKQFKFHTTFCMKIKTSKFF